MGIILEPRLLFDASVGGTTNKDNHTDSSSSTTSGTTDGSHSTTDKSTTTTPAPVDQSTAAQAKTAASTTPTADAQKTGTSADPSASKDTSSTSGTAQSGASGATASSTPIDSVLFVDPRVSGWQDLANSVSASTKVVVIDPTLDGITQVTQTLSQLHGIKEVDFLTYGQSGQIELGASTVTDASLMANATAVAGWRNSLSDNAQIQFWGCDVGAGQAGAAFVNDLHTLTGVGVAASTDATGAAALNGDWNLERTAGTVTAFQPFSTDAESHFDTVLDAPQATVTLDLPDSVLLGDSYTATLTFTNTATNGVGYAPFVELFVQTNTGTGATEASTLQSATFLGAPVTVTAVTIVDLDGAGPGTALGATNPFLLDSSGNPTVVTPPAGFKAGDTMYVLNLPFGSFTPGQPTATITLNFSNDSHSNLSSAHALTMTAIGGYQYGADPLNNPGTDPSILDTTHTATDSANVKLINVTTQVNTWPGDGETATGPSFPGTYVFNLTPASAVTADPVNNVDFTFDVPSDVQYNGGTISITTAAGDTGTVKFTPSTSTPGGTLTVHFDHLSGAASISMPFYVPQTDSGSAQVVSSSTDAPTPITLTPAYHYTQISGSQWTPISGSFTTTPITVADAGTGTTLSFDAKSFAVQVTDGVTTDTGATGFSPGDTVTYSLNFQVSDFFKMNNLVLNDVLGDGMTLDPSVAPTLTLVRDGVTRTFSFNSISDLMTAINGQSVTTSGSNSFWSYTARDGSGQTAIAFDVGALLTSLDSAHGGSLLTGTNNGTYGTVTFQAKVLDKYTNINSGDSIREKDTTADSVTGTANVTSLVGGSPTNAITDGDSITNQEAAGGMQLVITKINGVDVTDPNNIKIQAGDLVTYEMEYDLTSGDYGDLNLNGYLPLPVYGVPGSLSAGTGLAVNTYSVLSQPTGDTNVPIVTTNATANSVSFDFGTHDSTGNAAGQKVAVQFTLQASDKPFADGLALTTQGQTTYTNAGGDLLATAAIKQQTIQEPSLTIKTGVVSVVNDANSTKTVTYSNDGGVGSTDPTGVFDPATGVGIFVGSPPTTIGDAENQNVSGVDGSDTVRIAETVQNTGHGDAYKITVGGTLPSGYSASDVSNLVVTRADGTTLTYTGSVANFFNGTGIVINGSDGTTGTPALKGAGDASHRDVLFVTYDLKTKSNQTVATTLTAAGTIINFFAAPAAATGFVSGGTVVGESASNLTDNATITTSSPIFTKTITAGDDSTNVTLNNVVVGETITYTFTLTIPEGGMTNVAFNDVMPSFLTAVVGGTVTFGTNVTHTGDNALTVTGNTVSANFGTVANTNADTAGTITFTVTARIANSTNVDGTTISNTGTVTSNGIPTLNSTVVATEKDPLVHETLTDNAGGSAVHSGQTVTYTLVLQNDGDAPAQDLLDAITLPAGLTFVPNSITQTGGSNSGVTIDQTGKTVSVSQLGIGAGNKLTFTFQATVDNNLASNTSLQVTTPATYTSMPGTVTGERSYNATGNDTVTTGVFTPTLVIVDQSNGTASTDGVTVPSQGAPTTGTDAVVGEIVRMKAYVEVPEGQNALDLAITLPTGLEFLNDGSATVALASPNGSITSSTLDPTGNGAIQVNDTTGFNVATYQPTIPIAAANILVTPDNVVHFDFGTLQNNANSTIKNYAIVEFNAVVQNVSGNQSGTSLGASVQANGTGTTASDTVTVREPAVSIAKTVTAIDQATGTVTWQVVVTNTGAAGSAPTAYDVNLTDTQSAGAQLNEGTIANLTHSGGGEGTLSLISGNGTRSLQATMNLAAGASETFTYTTTLTDKTAKLSDSTASVTWTSINSAVASTFYGSTDNAAGGGNATAGSTNGERTGAGGALNDYDQTATVGLNVVTGNAWQDLGSPLNLADQSLDSIADSELAGLAVTGTWASGSGTVTTNGSGNYSILLPDNVSATVSAPTASSPFTLVYDTDGTSGSAAPNHVEIGLSSAQAKITIAAGGAASYSGINFAYRTPDTAPVLGTWGATAGNEPTFTVGGAGVTLHTGTSTSVSDSQIDTLVGDGIGDYSGTILTIARDASQGGPVSTDTFGGSGTSTVGLFLNAGTVKYNGTTIGTYTMASGTLTVTFGAGTASSDVTNVLNNVTYSTSVNQLASGVLIDAKLTDNNTETGTTAGNHFQGTGGVKTSNIVTALIDVAPAAVAATFNEPNDSVPTGTNVTAEQGAAVALAPGLTVATGTFSQIELQIATNYVNGQDVLAFTNTAKVHGVFDPTTGKLTLTDQGGATAADWQAALRAVTYYNTSDTPTTASDASLDRSVSIKATSTGGDVVNGTLATVHVVTANDSPILTVGTITIPDVAEDSSAAPTGAVGFLVSTLAGIGTGPGNVTDQDGPAAAADIAVTSVDSTHGTWYFSTDNGATWTTLTVAAGHARLLNSDARLYFAPSTPTDWNGTISNALTYRAWDQFSGTAGTDVTLPSGLGSGINTPGSAYSSTVQAVNLVVDPVNDAPVASGTATLSTTEDAVEGTTSGSTVTTLFTSNFNDSRDTVPGGSSANTLAGIAITANAATAAQGTWRYSTDGGTTWTTIATTGLSDTTAIVLPNTARLEFLPAANWNGTPGGLTVRLIDSSSGAVSFSASSDVSSNGGITPISAATVPLGATVTAVNDSPIVSGNASTVTASPEDSHSAGDTVATLLGEGTVNYSDATDTISGGSTGTVRTGLAITGNAATAAQGKWEYSTDGGTTWIDIPTTGLSNTNAIVLSLTDKLRFEPTANWNGTPGALTAHVSDGTGGLPASGARDISANIGTTSQWSSGTIAINGSVPAVNDSPVVSGLATVPTANEDTPSATGTTVTTLLGQGTVNYSDATDTIPGGSTGTAPAGIAITANAATAAQGKWEYSTDGGTTWVDIPTTGLSNTNALVLAAGTAIRFEPVANWNGTPGSLTAHISDGDTGLPSVGTHDISANIGTTSQWSSGTIAINTVIAPINDAPVASGTATLSTTEDAVEGTTSGSTVTTLFTSTFNDSTDTVSGGSSANTLAGIAITGNAATAAQGTWRYSTDGGTTWTTIATTGLSDTTAIVLPNTARIEFLPAANWNGTPGDLTVRLIDSSSGAVSFSASSDVSSNGGITPISAATVPLHATVTPVNDSPVVSGSAASTTIVEDTPSATGDAVSSLIGQTSAHYSDAADTIPGGSTGTAAAGIAITGNAATAAQGVWQYSTDGGAHWTDIPTTVSDTAAIVIPTTATLRFDPAANWNGTPGSLTARISDGDTGLPSTGSHDLTGTVGGTGQWSSGTITIGETVTPFNDAPVATGTATLTTDTEDTSTPNTNTISSLFGGNFADGTDTVVGGSTANTLAGVAITADAATAAQGAWKYSLDGGTTWVDVPTGVSNTSALVLPQTAKLEFVPAANFNGTPGGLTIRLIDTSTDVAIPGVGTGSFLAGDNHAYTGIDVSTNGGTTAISAATVPLGTFVDPVNDAPIASGSVTLVTQGSSVVSLFTPSFSDTADQQRGVNSTDGSDANTLAGIAITGNAANPATQGIWQYSVDGGTTYTTIPTTVSDGAAIVLPDNAKIQFVGVPGYTGTPGGLTVRLIDTSTDVVIPGVGTGSFLSTDNHAYTGVDVSGLNDGGKTAVSAATVPFNTIVAGSVAGSYVEPNDSVPTGTNIDAEIAAQVAVNDTVILDQSPTNVYSSATFKVTGNFQAGEDVLAFLGTASTSGNITTYTGGSPVGDITASYDKSTGTLTLSGTTATNAQWQTALRSITYYDSSDTPSSATRTVTMSIVNNSVSQALGTSSVTVTPVNDSPVLDTGITLTVPDQIEDNSGAPTGAVGFLALSLVNRTSGPNNVTDPDGPGTTATTTGIAVTGIDTTEGTWYYSTDNGAHWTSFTLTGTQALHLTADSNARLYFQPTKLDWNGTLPNAITFRAWDGFDGAATGTISSIGSTGFGTGVNTAASAYSSAQESLPLTVDPVNDAPVASGTVALPPITAGDSPATGTVTTLFTPAFNDSRDTVPGGSSANDLAGIAITGNAATPGEGTWRYSVDGGTTWVDIPTTGLSDTHALVLSKTAMIEFVGNGSFVGTPGALTTRLIDTSTTAIAGVGTGASLATAGTAFTDIDVSANGGTTAISANTVPLDTVINPVQSLRPPIPPNDFLTQERDSIFGNAGQLGSHIFTGGLNTDWLLGENVFRVMEVGIPGVANVSADVFYGTVPKQNLYFEAVNLSGGSLPPWLFFDSSTLRFTGTPPEGSEGTIDARVIARDFHGREAVADVHIVIVREQTEILGLLRTSSNDRPPITVPNPPQGAPQGSPPPDAGNGTPIILDNRPNGNAPQPSGNTPPAGDGGAPQGNGNDAPSGNGPTGSNGADGRQGFGLSPQLREFSQAGRLARARSLLTALSAGPAAL